MINIVSDTTCDLPQEILRQYNITCLSQNVHMDGEVYQDGVNLDHEEFYQRLSYSPTIPETSAPDVDTFIQTYRDLIQAGATHILSIHLSNDLSHTIQNARTAAAQFNSAIIKVIDSGQVSMGTGFIVREAARLAQDGVRADEIIERIKDYSSRVTVLAAVDGFDYMLKSQRLGKFMTGLGSVFDIKPIITMVDGNFNIERVRTYARALGRMIDLMADMAPFEDYTILYSRNLVPARKFIFRANSIIPASQEPWLIEIDPIIGAHLGPDLVGLACVRRSPS